MKKRLLFAALAMVCSMGAFAFEEDDYVYTTSGRVKVTGTNLVANGDFSKGLAGWQSSSVDGIVSQETWKVNDGVGPNGESAVVSQGATEGNDLCAVWDGLTGGTTYMVSFDILAPEALSTSVGTTVSNNYADFFLNTDGVLTHNASAEDAPVVNVAASVNLLAEWQNVAFVFTPDEGQQLVMHFERLLTGTSITNIELHAVEVVFDDRIAKSKIEFVQKILSDPNFDTEEAADKKAVVEEDIDYILESLESGDLDDPSAAESEMENLDADLKDFMDASSSNLTSEEYFQYITDLTTFPKYNRGNISDGQQIGGFIFRGANWLHGSGADVLVKQIQGTYAVGAGSVALFNNQLPAGKYFISGEVRNAYCDKNYNLTWTLESQLKMFVGSDSIDCGTILGEDFQKFYYIADVKEGETFEAGFYWYGPETGARFEAKNFEVRAFGDVMTTYERNQAWSTFITQWDAAVSARNNVVSMIDDANYPWANDSLQAALTKWDPYYNAVIEKNWVDADGNDTGVATNDELTDWAKYQGVEIYNEEGTKLDFQVVRGYQNAISYVKAAHQVFVDLTNEIAKAESLRDDDMNLTGDKTTFQAAIDAAQATHDNILKSTTDATMQADSLTLANAIVTLKEAEETFKASVKALEPIVDIDFSNGFQPSMAAVEGDEPVLQGFFIPGAAGQMDFPLSAVTYDELTKVYSNAGTTFGLGYGDGEDVVYGDLLRVGNNTATVTLPVEVTDNDVVRAQFDIWFGNLITKYIWVELQNAAGERVAGFKYSKYDAAVAYNDFNNQTGEPNDITLSKSNGGDGMDIRKYATGVGSSSQSNGAIAAANNCTSFDLLVDYKAETLQGSIKNPQTVGCDGAAMPITKLEDNKIVKFVIGSDYNNADRRCWFDNLKIFKYPSQAAGPNGIANVNAATMANGAIYSITGVKLSEKPAKGLYIMNGKKYVVK